MLNRRRAMKPGFTLPEVLVTVAIVAVLAAVVVPTVTSQISKGDEANFQTGATNIRTGITAFVSDTRRWPSRVSDLYNKPLATDVDLFANQYSAAAVNRWRGPYVSGALAAGADLNLTLAAVADALKDSSLVTAGGTGYVIASLKGLLTTASAARVDSLIDGGNGRTAGIVRWTAAADPLTDGEVKLQIMGSR